MTDHYTLPSAERQNELTRRVQAKIAEVASMQNIVPQPSVPDALPNLAETQPVTSVVR